MDSDAAEAEDERTVRPGCAGGLFRKVGVFDDRYFSGDHAEVSEFLHGSAFWNGLCGHISVGPGGQSYKERVDAMIERIVDLEIGDVFDAAFGHVVQCAASAQCVEASAVPLAAEGERVLVGQEDFPVQVHHRHLSLREEKDVPTVQAEVIVLVEELARGGVVGPAGHYVPRDGRTVMTGCGEDLFGEYMEEGFVPDGRNGKASFGSVESKPRSFPTRDDESGHQA